MDSTNSAKKDSRSISEQEAARQQAEAQAAQRVKQLVAHAQQQVHADELATQDVLIQRIGHFARGFANAGEYDFTGGHTCRQCAAQFTFGYYIHASAQGRHGFQHGLVGIGLHSIIDGVIGAFEGVVHHFVMAL